MHGVLDHAERLQQEPLHLPRESGLIGKEVGDLDPERRRQHRLVGSTLRGKADAGGAGDENETRLRVRRVKERVEPPREEAVVERADRKEPPPGQLGRQAQHRQEDEEGRLPDPELEVLAGRRLLPPDQGPESVALERVVSLARRVHPASIHPPGQVGRRGHVGRHGHEGRVETRLPRESRQDVAEGLLRRRRRPGRELQPIGDGHRRRRAEAPGEAHALGHQALDVPPLGALGRERSPLVLGSDSQLALERGQLLPGQLSSVVQRISGKWQPPALEGPREHRHRPVRDRVRFRESVDDDVQVVAAQVREQPGDFFVPERVEPGARLRRRSLAERLPCRGRRETEERLVLEVLHALQPVSQPGALRLGEEPLETPPESQRHDVPAERAEEPLQLLAPMVAHYAVEALTVQVDDHHVPGQISHRLFRPRLPDAPLVELGVPHQGDVPRAAGGARLAGLGLAGTPEAVVEVPVHERREGGRHRAQAHRARREVEPVRILRAARVGLEAAERSVRAKALGREEPAQDLDRVKDW